MPPNNRLLLRDATAAALLRREGTLTIKDKEKRIVEVSLSSETPVQRWGDTEILSHEAGHVRLDRLRNVGAFHLDHDTTKRVAAIKSVEIRDRKVYVTLQFGRTALADDAWKDVEDGILRGTSAGYRIHKVQIDEDTRTLTAVDWEIYEGSFTSIPADPNVGVGRSADDQMTLWRSLTTNAGKPAQESSVNKLRAILALILSHRHLQAEIEARAEKIPGDTITQAQLDEIRTWAEANPAKPPKTEETPPGDERARAQELRESKVRLDMVMQARGLDIELSEEDVNGVRTIDQAKDMLLRKFGEKNKRTPAEKIDLQVGLDATDKLRDAAVDGLLACTFGERACGDAKDQGLRRKSPCEILRAMVPDLRDADKDQLARFATGQRSGLRLRDANQSAANFSYVLGNYADKAVLIGYNSAPRTHEQWTSERLVDDFKDVQGIAVQAGLLAEQKAKGSPAEELNMAEAFYNAALGLYLRTAKFTYQDWRNDDLGLFADVLRMSGNIAANTEEWLSYKAVVEATWTNRVTNNAAFWSDTNDRLKYQGLGSTQADFESRKVIVGSESIQLNPVLGFMLVPLKRYAAARAALGHGQVGSGPTAVPVADNVRIIKTPWLSNSSLSGYSADDYYLGAGNMDTVKVLRDRLFPRPRVMQIDAGATPDMHFLIMHAFRAKMANQDAMQKGDWA